MRDGERYHPTIAPGSCLSVTRDRRCKHKIRSLEGLWSSFGTRLFPLEIVRGTRDDAGAYTKREMLTDVRACVDVVIKIVPK